MRLQARALQQGNAIHGFGGGQAHAAQQAVPMGVPVQQPQAVPMGVPVQQPQAVPMGVPVQQPQAVPMGVPVQQPQAVPMGVPVQQPQAVPMLQHPAPLVDRTTQASGLGFPRGYLQLEPCNPSALPRSIVSRRQTAREGAISLGPASLSSTLIQRLTSSTPVTPVNVAPKLSRVQSSPVETRPSEPARLPISTLSPSMTWWDGGHVVTQPASGPRIGDVRVSWRVSSATSASALIALDSRGVTTPWASSVSAKVAGSSTEVAMLDEGDVSLEAMLASMESQAAVMVWALRALCFLLFTLSSCMLTQPLLFTAERLPCGGLIGQLVGWMACVASLLSASACMLIATAICWISFRPLVGSSLLTVALVCGVLVCRLSAHGRRVRKSEHHSYRSGAADGEHVPINEAECELRHGQRPMHMHGQPMHVHGQPMHMHGQPMHMHGQPMQVVGNHIGTGTSAPGPGLYPSTSTGHAPPMMTTAMGRAVEMESGLPLAMASPHAAIPHMPTSMQPAQPMMAQPTTMTTAYPRQHGVPTPAHPSLQPSQLPAHPFMSQPPQQTPWSGGSGYPPAPYVHGCAHAQQSPPDSVPIGCMGEHPSAQAQGLAAYQCPPPPLHGAAGYTQAYPATSGCCCPPGSYPPQGYGRPQGFGYEAPSGYAQAMPLAVPQAMPQPMPQAMPQPDVLGGWAQQAHGIAQGDKWKSV